MGGGEIIIYSNINNGHAGDKRMTRIKILGHVRTYFQLTYGLNEFVEVA